MKLNEIKDNEGARKRPIRVGRGIGSSKGKTCGRGGKGQTARTGVRINGFEGGQTPIHRRLPKRGFNNYTRVEFDALNLSDIERGLASGVLNAKETIDLAALKKAGLVRSASTRVKLLAKGEIKSKVKISVTKASATAKAAIEKVGGELVLSA